MVPDGDSYQGVFLKDGRCVGYRTLNADEKQQMMPMPEKLLVHGNPDRISKSSAGPENECPGHIQLTNDHLQRAAFLAKSLSDGNRLRILLLISSGRKSVSAIVENLELSQPLVSHHLKELKRSLLVKVEREGPFIYYELADARILDVVQTLSRVATDLLSERTTF
jgi:DNA-binding transcriptional ArsR family regulator